MKDYKKTYHIVKSNIDNSYILLCELEGKKSIGFCQILKGSKTECKGYKDFWKDVESEEILEDE